MPKPSAQHLDACANSLREHRTRSNVSLREHVDGQRAALWISIRQRQRVYLDTRYWILLRDAALGRPKQAVHAGLLEVLRERVRSGLIFCPLSDGSLLELLRQSDSRTRLATAKLMDELSLGVAIQNARDRLQTEVLQLITAEKKPGAVPRPPVESVWLKAAYTLGVVHPLATGFDSAEQLALAKGFFDLMWSLTLEELLVETPEPPEEIEQAFRATAADLTMASKRHVAEIRSWRALYADEVRGFLDAHADDIQAAFLALYRLQHPGMPPPDDDALIRSTREATNVLGNLIVRGKAGNALPRVQIEAGVHAIVRWHRTRSFSAQDFVDMHHATAALPYCHLFLTERFLGTALSRPPLDLSKQFGVEVLWDADAAMKAVVDLRAARA
jgi:hypothetical protein